MSTHKRLKIFISGLLGAASVIHIGWWHGVDFSFRNNDTGTTIMIAHFIGLLSAMACAGIVYFGKQEDES